jgi:hypothetical protein
VNCEQDNQHVHTSWNQLILKTNYTHQQFKPASASSNEGLFSKHALDLRGWAQLFALSA